MSLTESNAPSAASGVAVLEQLQEQLPKVRYLALYRLPELKTVWVFDFQNQSFLSATRQRAFKPLINSADVETFESQCTHYTGSVEYFLRSDSALIGCWSSKELTNTRLLEAILRDLQSPISAVTPPERKKKPQRAVRSEDPVEAFWEGLETYEPVKRLSLRPYLLSQVVRHKEDGQLKVLKCLRQGDLQAYPELAALLAAEPDAYEVCQGAGGAVFLLRPFGEGVALRELLNKVRQFSPAQVQAVLVRLLEGLQGLHARGRAHGNLLPQNVLINREKQMHLLDPFLGEVHQAMFAAKQDLAWFNEARFFMAPEWATSPRLPGHDIYALGVLAVYMLVGHTGFTQSLGSVRQAELPEQLHKLAANLLERRYPELFKVIAMMLAPSPEDRPATGAALRALFAKLTIN
ncbi:MAG: protein kinase domain-containing protein [Candidatus Sericytochromatia bacterium]